MTDDLLARLRATFDGKWFNPPICEEAAARIEAQARRIEGLEAGLRKIEGRVYGSSHNMGSGIVNLARAALTPSMEDLNDGGK